MPSPMNIAEYGKIRVTPDCETSVFDLIQVCSDYANPKSRYEAWNRLLSEHPEVYSKVVFLKFPGRGQKETPVANREDALYILELLPQVTGKKYKELAANAVLALLENPEELAKAAMTRSQLRRMSMMLQQTQE